MNIREIITNIMTGKDGRTHDVVRVLLVIGALVFLGVSVWHVYANKLFDPLAFGTGFGTILTGGGAALGLKAKTEPD